MSEPDSKVSPCLSDAKSLLFSLHINTLIYTWYFPHICSICSFMIYHPPLGTENSQRVSYSVSFWGTFLLVIILRLVLPKKKTYPGIYDLFKVYSLYVFEARVLCVLKILLHLWNLLWASTVYSLWLGDFPTHLCIFFVGKSSCIPPLFSMSFH